MSTKKTRKRAIRHLRNVESIRGMSHVQGIKEAMARDWGSRRATKKK